MSSWSSYPSIFALGHRAIKDLLSVSVNVEEKIDGSQFSFGLVEASPVDIEYKPGLALKIRSKGCVMHIDAPEKMFALAAATVRGIADFLVTGWTYRGEFLARPKHNALAYDRVPSGNIIIYDINTGDQEYLSYEDKVKEATRLGLEVVPRLFAGKLETVEQFRQFMGTVSVLGGQAIEGVVVKPVGYLLYGTDKKVLMGKYVSEAFKEVHRKAWGESNPSRNDVLDKIIASLTTPARWAKAVQHLREAGQLEGSPRDIGKIIKEVPTDILKEEEEWIKESLWKHCWPQISRGVTRGLPDWYKNELLRASFETPEQGSNEVTIADNPTPTNDNNSNNHV